MLDQVIAADLRMMATEAERSSPRTVQTAIGPSEIGDPCTRCLAAKILGVFVDQGMSDPWCRIIGTAVHAWLDEAAARQNVARDHARWIPEHRVFPDPELLPVGGSADLYDSDRRIVIDHKIVGKTQQNKYKTNGPGLRYRRQAHLYGLGYSLKGHQVDHVAMAFWLRGGYLSDLWVHVEPYDEAVATETLDRYRMLRDLVLPLGPNILPNLPTDPECYSCGRK